MKDPQEGQFGVTQASICSNAKETGIGNRHECRCLSTIGQSTEASVCLSPTSGDLFCFLLRK